MPKKRSVVGSSDDDPKDVLKNCNAELNSFMETVLSGIVVDKKKKDRDPLDADDKKAKRDFFHAHALVMSSKLARAIFAWKLKTENILRKKGKKKEEVEEIGRLLGGMSPSNVYVHCTAGRIAHLLFLAEVEISELPRSIDALAAFGVLNKEDVAVCYKECKSDHKEITAEIAKKAVSEFMENNPDDYEAIEEDPEPKKELEPGYKAMTKKITTVMAEIKVYIATNAKNKAARKEMENQRNQLVSILKLYEKVLVVKTHRSNGNDGE